MGPLITHPASQRAIAAGFTLTELLVVLVILGIAATFVVVRLGADDRRDMQREAKRLAGALEHAAAVAQWTGETLGVSAEGGIYRFWRRDGNDHWNLFAGDETLAPRALPGGITVTPGLYAGAPVPVDSVLPFRASGRNEPYSLTLTSPAGTIVVAADPLNRVGFETLVPAVEATTATSMTGEQTAMPPSTSMPPPDSRKAAPMSPTPPPPE